MRISCIFGNNRFIQVETGFFWLWWNEQTDDMKETVMGLVSTGQMQIAGGGWSMADEAATHYSAFVDNMGVGLNTMKDALGMSHFSIFYSVLPICT